MHNATRFTARSLVMIEMPAGRGMHVRPYQATGNGEAISKIQRTMELRTAQNQQVTPGDLSSFASQLLCPSVETEGVVNIANGWDTRRLRFVLELEAISASGRQWYIVTGYTSHSEVSLHGSVDPDMDLFFNNIIRLREAVHVDFDGRRIPTRKLAGSYQLFCVKDDYKDYNTATGLSSYSRPQPKLSMTPANILGRLEVESTHGRSRYALDTRSYVGAGTAVSMATRNNNLSSHYLARTANALDHGIRTARWTGSDNHDLPFDPARAFTSARENAMGDEPNPVDDDFVGALTQTNYPMTGCISYAEMVRLFGNHLDEICKVVVDDVMAMASNVNDLGFNERDTQSWDTRYKETEIASLLVQAVPTLMSECLLARVVFHATNITIDGRDSIEIVDAMSLLQDVDPSDFMNMFMNNFSSYVSRDFTYGGQFGYTLSMECEMMGETRISLSIDNGHRQDFYAPSYCDNLFAPTLTNNNDRMQNVASDIRMISGF